MTSSLPVCGCCSHGIGISWPTTSITLDEWPSDATNCRTCALYGHSRSTKSASELCVDIGRYHVYSCQSVVLAQSSQPHALTNYLVCVGDWQRIQKIINSDAPKTLMRRRGQPGPSILPEDVLFCRGALQTYNSERIMCGIQPPSTLTAQFAVHLETYGLDHRHLHRILPTLIEMVGWRESKRQQSLFLKCWFGLVMTLAAPYFSTLFESLSCRDITRACAEIEMTSLRSNAWSYSMIHSRIPQLQREIANLHILCSQGVSKLREEGVHLMKHALMHLPKYLNGNPNSLDPGPIMIFWTHAKMHHYHSKNYDKALEFYALTAVAIPNHYLKVVSLIEMSNICRLQTRYSLSSSLLRMVFAMCCKMDVMPRFVSCDYDKKRRGLRKSKARLTCVYCGKRALEQRLKVCKGCMRSVYCSRTCQKADWSSQHREVCDGMWSSMYSALLSIVSLFV